MSQLAAFHHDSAQKTVQDIVNLYREDQLELSPGFQRNSVWTERDRAKLIDSVMPELPAAGHFLYRRHEEGQIIYDVIDGKQRIESILMFMGVIRGNRFPAKLQLHGDEDIDWCDWRTICRRKLQHHITGYNLRTIEIDGDPSDVNELFVRLNSTGKA